MTLESFEKELAASKEARHTERDQTESRDRDKGGQKHRRRHHLNSKHHEHPQQEDQRSRHHRKRSRRKSQDSHDDGSHDAKRREPPGAISTIKGFPSTKQDALDAQPSGKDLHSCKENISPPRPKRDTWMEVPLALDIDYVQRKKRQSPPTTFVQARVPHAAVDTESSDLHGNTVALPTLQQPAQHEVDYVNGDAGTSWRMTKLKAVYRQAKETGKSVDEVAQERYGDLREFDDAREEEIELDRRETYGNAYVGKQKPSGELFQERKLDMGIRRDHKVDEESEDEFEAAQGQIMEEEPQLATTVVLDQTALNRLKAQMMKAKLKQDPEAAKLEAAYSIALAVAANSKQPDIVVLSKMESRMLDDSRKGETNPVLNTHGRERGLVEENENMTIEDMVRHERRTRGQHGGSGRAFAERIVKDGKFTADLDYMYENADRLAKSVRKSDVSLRSTAIGDFQRMKRVLDTCPLCYHEDTATPPQAPVVSLATRVYLTLPTAPEITPYGLCASVVPVQHRLNLLECDDDEWEEIRNFMKSLSRFYYAQDPPLGVLFYENAAHEGRKRHASLEAVPLPLGLTETAPAFFKEAILTADEEWTQHRKLIDTLAKATNGGMGKMAFRKTMVSELPYFHVWFTLDGGLGHVVEDTRRWPKGDLFAREIIGGMLDVGAEVIKKQGRWRRGDVETEKREKKFKKNWDKWDWTVALLEPQ